MSSTCLERCNLHAWVSTPPAPTREWAVSLLKTTKSLAKVGTKKPGNPMQKSTPYVQQDQKLKVRQLMSLLNLVVITNSLRPALKRLLRPRSEERRVGKERR